MSDAQVQSRFLDIERALVGWWSAHQQAVVFCEFGEWFVRIGDRRFSISEQALAATQALEGRT